MGGSTTLMGLPASPGIAVGRAWTVDRRKVRTPRRTLAPDEVEGELARLATAVEASARQLEDVRAKVAVAEGAEHLGIIDVHRAMLRDPTLVEEVRRLVREERVNVEWAVKRAVRKIKASFSSDDEFFRERRSDVDYVGERIIKNLLGHGLDNHESPPHGSVILARDLSPADTALLLHDRRVAGMVTDVGGVTSHTAIVARALEIPAVVGAGRASSAAQRGDWVVVDGGRGLVILNPSPGERADYEMARSRQLEREVELARLKDLPAETQDGVPVRMLGNIEFAEEVAGLLSHGGEGVGLYRTEFLYLSRERLPTEEDHYRDYRRILEAMGRRPVTVRTFDLGGDKLPAGQRDHAENPALGLRAIRYCLRHPDMFRAQLRALLRAGGHGNLRIMFPMVSGVGEIRAGKRMLLEAREELAREGIEVALPPVGIMVELPSAAMLADRLAPEVDFLSIGTNDLIQYTIGVDRQNKDVAYLYRPLHLAVLRTLKFVCDAGRAAGIPVSMCGEMAGEPLYTMVLLGLGFSELSMNGPSIPPVKRVIRSSSSGEGRELVERLLELTHADDIEREVRAEMTRRFPGLLETSAAVGPAGG
ncbi:MAG TPA: phosphoenolpyruvate--protein phosphotransferase [Anaeromyxobacteraceae bacterium]|nr:phosphoenolpyruvate--protein phosphotransferase [Anaeromyxobacteraceae bacterium]